MLLMNKSPKDREVEMKILQLAKEFQPPSQLQDFLWNWLSSTPESPAELLPLFQSGTLVSKLGTASFKGFQQEEPYLRLIASLPSGDNPFRAYFWRSLGLRLGDLFQSLAEDSTLRDSLSEVHWSGLVNFAHRVCMYDGIAKSVIQLQERFDTLGYLPFHGNLSLTFEFSRLLGRLQTDNRFKDRWVKQIKFTQNSNEIPDRTLRANYLLAWQSYCLMPELVRLDEFEEVANLVCERINSDFKSKEVLKGLGFELVRTPTSCMSNWIRLAFARLWDSYQWLPDPHPELHLIACVDELAVLGQLIELFENRRESHYKSLASLKYDIISRKLLHNPTATRTMSRFRKFNQRDVSNLTWVQIIQFCQRNWLPKVQLELHNQMLRQIS